MEKSSVCGWFIHGFAKLPESSSMFFFLFYWHWCMLLQGCSFSINHSFLEQKMCFSFPILIINDHDLQVSSHLFYLVDLCRFLLYISKYFTSSEPHRDMILQFCHSFWNLIMAYMLWHSLLAFLLTFYYGNIFWFSILAFFLAFYLFPLQRFFVVKVRWGTLRSSAWSWGPAEAEEATAWHKI